MSFNTINYEISLWKNTSLVVDGVSMIHAIRNWLCGRLGMSDLFIKLLDLSCTLIDRYFNKDKHEAVAKAYETLGLSQKPRTKDRNVILKRYKELTQVYHPDKGGSIEKMKDINVARDIILESLY